MKTPKLPAVALTMPVRRLLGWAATLAVLTACTESPTQPLESPLLVAAADANPVVGSATGSGHTPCATVGPFLNCDPTNPDGGLRTFSFNAQVHADGSVGGRAQVNNRENGVQFQGKIVCMRFTSDNIAWMVLEATHAPSNPEAVGDRFFFAVEDNGEGSGADPDRLTNLGPGPLARAAVCTPSAAGDVLLNQIESFFFYDVVNGNVQVRAP